MIIRVAGAEIKMERHLLGISKNGGISGLKANLLGSNVEGFVIFTLLTSFFNSLNILLTISFQVTTLKRFPIGRRKC